MIGPTPPQNADTHREIGVAVIGESALVSIYIADTGAYKKRCPQDIGLPTHADIVITEVPVAPERIADPDRKVDPVVVGMQRRIAESHSALHRILVAFRTRTLKQPHRPRKRHKERKTRIETVPHGQFAVNNALLYAVVRLRKQTPGLKLPDHTLVVIHKRLCLHDKRSTKQTER